MDINEIVVYFVLGLGALVLAGFFKTKKIGYGPFNSSTLLLILVLILSTSLVLLEKIPKESFINIVFSVIGFATALFTKNDKD